MPIQTTCTHARANLLKLFNEVTEKTGRLLSSSGSEVRTLLWSLLMSWPA
jgi:hypothetical protein